MPDPHTVTTSQAAPEPDPAQGPAREGEDLAGLLLRVIDEADITQKDLAALAGIPYATLNAWVKRTRGTSRVSPEKLRDIVRVVNSRGVELTTREIFRAAGRPVPGPTDEEREARLLSLYRQLPRHSQRALIQSAEAMLQAVRAS